MTIKKVIFAFLIIISVVTAFACGGGHHRSYGYSIKDIPILEKL